MTPKDHFTDIKKNRKLHSFLGFLLLSTLFWFITALSGTYTYLTTYGIVYNNMPDNLEFQSQPPTNLQAQIDATGFRVLSHKLYQKDLIIDVSQFVKKGKYSYYYLPNNEIVALQKQVYNEKLLRFSKDTLSLDLGVLKTVKVPVVSKVELEFKPGFRVKGDLVFVPDSIVVKGSEKFLDSIQFIKTKEKRLINLDQDFKKRIPLDIPFESLTYSQTEVELIGTVTKFTEGELEIPLQFEGFGEKQDETKIRIKFQVAFEDYSKLNKTSFKVSATYPQDTISKGKVRIHIEDKPDFVSDVVLSPKWVTYKMTNTN